MMLAVSNQHMLVVKWYPKPHHGENSGLGLLFQKQDDVNSLDVQVGQMLWGVQVTIWDTFC